MIKMAVINYVIVFSKTNANTGKNNSHTGAKTLNDARKIAVKMLKNSSYNWKSAHIYKFNGFTMTDFVGTVTLGNKMGLWTKEVNGTKNTWMINSKGDIFNKEVEDDEHYVEVPWGGKEYREMPWDY